METEGITYGIIFGCLLVIVLAINLLPIAINGYNEVETYNKDQIKIYEEQKQAYLNQNITVCWNSTEYGRLAKDGIYYFVPKYVSNCTPNGFYIDTDNSIHIRADLPKIRQLQVICHEKIHQEHFKNKIIMDEKEERLTREEEMERCKEG